MKTKKYARAAKSVKQKKPMNSMWSTKPNSMTKKRCKMVIRISKSTVNQTERKGWVAEEQGGGDVMDDHECKAGSLLGEDDMVGRRAEIGGEYSRRGGGGRFIRTDLLSVHPGSSGHIS